MKDREDKVRTLRLFQVADYIKNSHYPNAPELCKKFEVSRSTMMRDIEFLQTRYNAPIEYDFVNRGYYYTDPTFTIQSIMLSEGELMTVATILPLMEQYKNTPLEATFKSIMMKMIEMMPNKVEIDSPFSTHHVQFIKDPLPEISETTFNSVFDSIRSSKTMEFSYRSISKQSYTRRRFDPYKVLCQKGNWYVIGYCHLHERFNVFSLSRMKDVQISNDAFEIKKDFKLEKYIDPDFGIWNSDEKPKKIELIFSKEINTYILERTWHVNQKCKQQKDGSVYLTFMSNQLQETLHWVMSFGSSVQVVNPPELVDMVKEEIKKLKKMY